MANESSAMSPRQVRRAAGWSLLRVRASTGASEQTIRVYEANRSHVTLNTCQMLDPLYAELAGRLARRLAATEASQ